MNGFINSRNSVIFVSLLTVVFYSCSTVPISSSPRTDRSLIQNPSHLVVTSHYSQSLAGNRTASGEIYDPRKLTCAHKTLPFGTMVKVTNPKNSKEVIVKINDRGPFIRGRELDISNAAATQLAISGVQQVEMEVLDYN